MTNEEIKAKVKEALKKTGYVRHGGDLKQAEVARRAKMTRQTIYHKLKVKKALTAKDINELLSTTDYTWDLTLTNSKTGDVI